jgi:hypothetical protein
LKKFEFKFENESRAKELADLVEGLKKNLAADAHGSLPLDKKKLDETVAEVFDMVLGGCCFSFFSSYHSPSYRLFILSLQTQKLEWELRSTEWDALLKGARVELFNKGDVVLNAGEKNSAIYQVAKGVLLVERSGQPSARLEQNQIVGEMSYLLKNVATATITADSEVEMYKFEGGYLDLIGAAEPRLAAKFFYYLCSLLKGRFITVHK